MINPPVVGGLRPCVEPLLTLLIFLAFALFTFALELLFLQFQFPPMLFVAALDRRKVDGRIIWQSMMILPPFFALYWWEGARKKFAGLIENALAFCVAEFCHGDHQFTLCIHAIALVDRNAQLAGKTSLSAVRSV